MLFNGITPNMTRILGVTLVLFVNLLTDTVAQPVNPCPTPVPVGECPKPGGYVLPNGAFIGVLLRDSSSPTSNKILEGIHKQFDQSQIDGGSLEVNFSSNDCAHQASALNDLIVKGARAIVVEPVGGNCISDAVKRAGDAGIFTIAVGAGANTTGASGAFMTNPETLEGAANAVTQIDGGVTIMRDSLCASVDKAASDEKSAAVIEFPSAMGELAVISALNNLGNGDAAPKSDGLDFFDTRVAIVTKNNLANVGDWLSTTDAGQFCLK